ncbi:MAG: hypothetical protein NC328_02470 [Muribaculum sp.]|nr:hypothetical protein [Muribaculum sp.]
MKGQKIKEILRNEGFTLSEVASLLGFDNDQRLHSALKSDDVKSGLIEDIARVTNKSVGFFYGLPVCINDHGILDSDNATYNETEISVRFIGLLEKKDEQIDRLIGLLERK